MLKRLYVDNYHCFVNFELKFDSPMALLMGTNGSGKTTLFHVLRCLQRLICDRVLVEDVFRTTDCTRWLSLQEQKFEVDVEVREDDQRNLYSYVLLLEHNPDRRLVRVKEEKLFCIGNLLYATEWDRSSSHPSLLGQIYTDDFKSGTRLPQDWSQSGVGFLSAAERHDNKKMRAFKHALDRWVIVHPAPMVAARLGNSVSLDAWMEIESRQEQSRLDDYARNFASWYRHLLQEQSDNSSDLTQALREVLPGFHSISLKEFGEGSRVLKVAFKLENTAQPILYSFNELSDGQRMLIVLYTLLIGLKGQGQTLFIDELDNFLALREIQPWLNTLLDEVGESFEQAVLISHHPEIFDGLAGANYIKHLVRDRQGSVRQMPSPQAVDGLSLSQTIARGWEV